MLAFRMCLFTTLALVASPLAAPLLRPQDSDTTLNVPSVYELRFGGLGAMLADPRDAGLLRALEMLDERAARLEFEAERFGWPDDLPWPAFELAAMMGSGPLLVRGALLDEEVEGLLAAQLTALGLDSSQRQRAQDLLGLLFGTDLGELSDSLTPVPAPTPLWAGQADGEYVLRMGKQQPLPPASFPEPSLLPEGARPWLRTHVPLATLLGEQLSEEEQQHLDSVWGAANLMGPTLANVTLEAGESDDAQHMVMLLEGYAEQMRSLGFVPESGIQRELLEAVPLQATAALCFAFEPSGLLEVITRLSSVDPGGTDLRVALEEATGLDLEQDVLAALGTQAAMYATQPGFVGTLATSTFVHKLRDPKAWDQLVTRAMEASSAITAETNGYVRIQSSPTQGGPQLALVFPGMPVPVEMYLVRDGEWLVAASNQTQLEAALVQIRTDRPSLLDSESLARQCDDSSTETLLGTWSVTWIDTPALLPIYYPLLALGSSALANAVRDPQDPSIQPGLVMPAYRDLAQGARGALVVASLGGDDQVVHYRLDRSMLVNSAAFLANVSSSPSSPLILGGLGSAVLAPRLLDALDQAKDAQAQMDIRIIEMALIQFYIRNSRYPEDLKVLFIPDSNGARYLEAEWPMLDPWGEPYRYDPPVDAQGDPRVWSIHRDF